VTHRPLTLVALLLVSCGSAPHRFDGIDPTTGAPLHLDESSPAPSSWAGTWYSPQLGELVLTQMTGAVAGRYTARRGSCVVVGSFSGRPRGPLLRLRWTEDASACGRLEPIEGGGFFLFSADPELPTVGRLYGRWGYAWSESEGGAWSAERAPVTNR
jgi:hypothetical protein